MEETGWKLVHGDVFRPPRYTRLLSALVGSGVQVFSSTLFVIGIFYYFFNTGVVILYYVHCSYLFECMYFEFVSCCFV